MTEQRMRRILCAWAHVRRVRNGLRALHGSPWAYGFPETLRRNLLARLAREVVRIDRLERGHDRT